MCSTWADLLSGKVQCTVPHNCSCFQGKLCLLEIVTFTVKQLNFMCPRYNRELEGGKSFTVNSIKLWNTLPVTFRNCFKSTLLKSDFTELLTN